MLDKIVLDRRFTTKNENKPSDANDFVIVLNLMFGRAETNYIIARRFAFSIVRDRSFIVVLMLDRAWLVWSGCEMSNLRYITGTMIIYSVHEHDFESPWLWDVNHGNSYISLARFQLHLLTLINLSETG